MLSMEGAEDRWASGKWNQCSRNQCGSVARQFCDRPSRQEEESGNKRQPDGGHSRRIVGGLMASERGRISARAFCSMVDEIRAASSAGMPSERMYGNWRRRSLHVRSRELGFLMWRGMSVLEPRSGGWVRWSGFFEG